MGFDRWMQCICLVGRLYIKFLSLFLDAFFLEDGDDMFHLFFVVDKETKKQQKLARTCS